MVFSRQFVSNVSKVATGAVKHPLATVEFALGAAKHAVAKGTAAADVALTQLHSADWKARHAEAERAAKQAQADRDAADAAFATPGSTERAEPDDLVEESGADDAAAVDDLAEDERPDPDEIRQMPMPDLEPPVPVVEEALAEEANPEEGHATEPSAASRDEAHGDAALQRAEAEEIAEEMAEAFPPGDVTIETPVGTTGADAGHNPDTAEADLQQPGTPPLFDEATAKSIEAEAEILSKAAEPDKG
jgi:hypothetical protein